MTWIRTIPMDEADDKLRLVLEATRAAYPKEYAASPSPGGDSIVASHSLLPEVMHHIFSAFAAMMSPELPLSRAQHEMIATVVSAQNRCFY